MTKVYRHMKPCHMLYPGPPLKGGEGTWEERRERGIGGGENEDKEGIWNERKWKRKGKDESKGRDRSSGRNERQREAPKRNREGKMGKRRDEYGRGWKREEREEWGGHSSTFCTVAPEFYSCTLVRARIHSVFEGLSNRRLVVLVSSL
jgi:hypothetical protein